MLTWCSSPERERDVGYNVDVSEYWAGEGHQGRGVDG